MQIQDISCNQCGKFILAEQRGSDNEIRCIKGSYEDGYYDDDQDDFIAWNVLRS
mgnify:CR=1 FL=1